MILCPEIIPRGILCGILCAGLSGEMKVATTSQCRTSATLGNSKHHHPQNINEHKSSSQQHRNSTSATQRASDSAMTVLSATDFLSLSTSVTFKDPNSFLYLSMIEIQSPSLDFTNLFSLPKLFRIFLLPFLDFTIIFLERSLSYLRRLDFLQETEEELSLLLRSFLCCSDGAMMEC